MASYDVASDICQASAAGGGGDGEVLPYHPPHVGRQTRRSGKGGVLRKKYSADAELTNINQAV